VSDDLDDIRALAAEDETRAALRKALLALDKAKASKAELVAAVYQAARDAAATMTVPSVPHRGKQGAKRNTDTDAEAAILLMADWQFGKKTPTYSTEVATARLRAYADKVRRLIDYQRKHHPVSEARIYLLGDLLEGELIFPGQAHRIDASLYRQLFDGAGLLAEVVSSVASDVDSVKVVGVIGNHGSIGGQSRRDMHPESNADAMLYNIARLSVKDPRVDWRETLVSEERAWFAIDEVYGKRWLLWHSDQIKGSAFGYPWYGLGKKLLGYATSVAPFDYSVAGHWHVPVRVTLNAITHWGSGSPESGNTYAQEFLASGSQQPSQWLIFQGANGPTAEYLVRL